MVRIAEVLPGTIADELRLEIGSRVVRINGEVVRDALDFRFLEVDGSLAVEIAETNGGATIYEIDKEAGETLGIVTAPDPVRQCSNRCVFCFVDGNPDGARHTLYLKDDDFRLSFTYGSYVTLTNLGPRGLKRLIDQRLSPLYVSVHATEPEVRMRLLGVPRGGDIVRELATLLAGGLEVHAQVVLCPDWNDGAHLDRTIDDLWSLGPGVLSLSVVPVGLTRYNLNRPVRLLEPAEAEAAIEQVERGRARAQRERGLGWAYISDELWFVAGRPLPPPAYYDDWPLTENGVGAVRVLLDAFERGVATLPRLDGRRIAVVTGTRMAAVLRPLIERVNAATGGVAEVCAVENRYFGETVTSAGLLGGGDIAATVRGRAAGYDTVLVPAESLNDDGRFIDDHSLERLVGELAPARVVPAHELAAAFAAL
jgi:putative radical SAM enzyme (TIGR03279 family)